jgi:preprotein translocase subunit SecG
MSLDKIIVAILALIFFGGAILLALKSQREKNREDQPPSPSPGQNNEEGVSPLQPREKERRKSKI